MHTITQRENTDSNKKPLMYKRSSIILTTNFSSEIMEATGSVITYFKSTIKGRKNLSAYNFISGEIIFQKWRN